MGRYVLRRMGTGLVSLFVLITITFFLTRIMPGSPFQSGAVSELVVASMEEKYGLQEPVSSQYGTYLYNLMHGDLGISFQKPGVSVEDVIVRAWPITLSIGLPALIIALVVGVFLGICQVVSKNRIVRGSVFLGTIFATAIPNFVVALVLMLVLGQQLRLFPVAGITTPLHYVLPILSLAIYPTAVVARLMQNAFREEMQKEYVVLARAKGFANGRVYVGHVLRNAWIPVLNYIGPAAAFLITGSFVVENIFTIPGLGREFVLAISNRDYTMVMGLTIFMGMVVIGVHLLTDIVSAVLAPQIRHGNVI